MTFPWRGRAARWLAAGVMASSITAFSGAASAQTAADKATARQVATEGIKLYDEGKYDEALDRLKRAQALYSAPPHLLYIARIQTKLPEPQLVEAAENYRLLISTDLGAAPPPAFVRAVEDAKKELEALEPRIPALQIDVTPKDAKDIELTIDGAPVSSAVIGISRPVNPGKHVVAASAPGYAPVERTMEIAEGEKSAVALPLEPAAAGAATAAPAVEAPADSGASKPSPFGFMVGLRLGVIIPGGSLGQLGPAGDVSTSDIFKPSGALELHGGLRFARYFTGALFAELAALRAEDDLETDPGIPLDNSGSSGTVGLKVMVGTPRGQLGYFGELGIGIAHAITLTSKIQGTGCTRTATLTGPALRLGAGGVFPVGDLIHIVPFGAFSFSSFGNRKIETDGTCPASQNFAEFDQSIPDRERGTHTMLLLGVGGDFVFGRDLQK